MFILADLELEAVLRDGFTALRQDNTLVTDLFGDLLQPQLYTKYGDKEVNKLINFFNTKEVSIVHSFNLVPSNLPCISIQLIDNPEEVDKAHLSDFEEQFTVSMTPQELTTTVIVASIQPTAYNSLSGILSIPDSVDLTNVFAGQLFVDTSGNQFTILPGINNTAGSKTLIIGKGLSPNISAAGQIQSSVQYDQYEQQGVFERERLLLGIHTSDPLLTKYIYTVVKYTLNSRREILQSRGMQIATYSGSDFTRSNSYPGNTIFDRYVTVTVMTNNQWRADKVVPIEVIDLDITVPRDVASNEELGFQDQTVQVQDDDFQS